MVGVNLGLLALLGAAQGMMLVLALLSLPSGNRRANRALAAFIAVLALRLLALAGEYSPQYQFGSPQVSALLHLAYAVGPLLYAYAVLLAEPQRQLRPVHLWHLAPVPVAALLLLPGGPVFGPELVRLESFAELPAEQQRWAVLATLPLFSSLLMYAIAALRLLRRHRARIAEEFSALEVINLNWLRALAWACVVLAAASLLSESLRAAGLAVPGPRAGISVLLSVLMMYAIGLLGLRQPLIFDGGERAALNRGEAVVDLSAPAAAPSDAVPDAAKASADKYRRSGLDSGARQRIYDKLQALMVQEQPYLQPGIRLADLAAQVGTLPNYLSQAINSCAGESFFDFINRHRVEESCRRIEKRPSQALTTLAQDCGFNSQNVFNSHFKKHMGVTPSQYRKSVQAGISPAP